VNSIVLGVASAEVRQIGDCRLCASLSLSLTSQCLSAASPAPNRVELSTQNGDMHSFGFQMLLIEIREVVRPVCEGLGSKTKALLAMTSDGPKRRIRGVNGQPTCSRPTIDSTALVRPMWGHPHKPGNSPGKNEALVVSCAECAMTGCLS